MTVSKILLSYDIGGRSGANVFYHSQTVAGLVVGLDDYVQIAREYAIQWGAHIAPALSDQITLEEVVCSTVDGIGMGTWSVAQAGGNSNAAAPPNVAYLIRKQLAGLSRTGRTYLPGAIEVGIDAFGNVSGGTVTDNTNRMNAFLSDVNANVGGNMAIEVGKAIGPDKYPYVLSFSCDTKVATMRNRLRG